MRLRVGLFVLAMSVIGAGRAEANIWDWLEELNGPGPARSRGNFMVNIRCSGTSGLRADKTPLPLGRVFQIPRDANNDITNATSCFFVDFRRLRAEEDARFHPVDISITEVGVSAWVHPAVEIGAGIGLMRFSSEDPETSQQFSGGRMTISFPRFVFKPLLAAPTGLRSDAAWGFLQLYFKETIIVGDLTNSDFASKPGTVFDRRHQRVESMGFIIDVPAAVRVLAKLR